MTLAVMESFGVTAANHDFADLTCRPPLTRAAITLIESDASAASYFFALAAVTGGTITVEGLGTSSIQGDMAFVDVLERMGCTVTARARPNDRDRRAPARVDVDMNAFSDTVMTLAVRGTLCRRRDADPNVAHIRHKETDRIAALAAELRKLGARVDEFADGLVIHPPHPDRLQGEKIPTYNDHRMAMSFALAGLIPDVTILDPGCVAKTYPDFWTDLETHQNRAFAVNRPRPSERA